MDPLPQAPACSCCIGSRLAALGLRQFLGGKLAADRTPVCFRALHVSIVGDAGVGRQQKHTNSPTLYLYPSN